MSNFSSDFQFFNLLNLYRSAEFMKLQNKNNVTNESILLTHPRSFTKPTYNQELKL